MSNNQKSACVWFFLFFRATSVWQETLRKSRPGVADQTWTGKNSYVTFISGKSPETKDTSSQMESLRHSFLWKWVVKDIYIHQLLIFPDTSPQFFRTMTRIIRHYPLVKSANVARIWEMIEAFLYFMCTVFLYEVIKPHIVNRLSLSLACVAQLKEMYSTPFYQVMAFLWSWWSHQHVCLLGFMQ